MSGRRGREGRVTGVNRLRGFGAVSLWLWCLCVPGIGRGAEDGGIGFEPQDGDSFVFLGDSITHQSLYTQYVENFFYTRYPDRRMHFHNAGVSGDKAGDAVARFEEDVAAFKPDYVSVLLGMNDGAYEDFDVVLFGDYKRDMGRLLDGIDGAGGEALVMSPTMFDHAQHRRRSGDPTYRFLGKPRSPDYNALMAFYGAWGRERTMERGLRFVNMWGPLNDHTVAQRREEAEFSLVPDAIHPGPGGHLVMAFSLLEDLGPERRTVSSIGAMRRGEQWRVTGSGEVSEVEGDGERVAFTFLARSLPWVIPELSTEEELRWKGDEDARLGYELTKAGHKLSNERLRVVGLAPGRYEIRIDGKPVKTVTHAMLAAKVELQENVETPQYQQALEVARLNREKSDKAVRPMRDLWSRVKGVGQKSEADPEKAVKLIEKMMLEIEALLDMQEDYEDRIYAAAQPLPRRYEVVRVGE
jgi:lysophospholipase L1-like esterase